MKLHTLGPTNTDSFHAARYFQTLQPHVSIHLHSAFEEIYAHLAEYRGDLLLVPTAFRSKTNASWGELHYRYLAQLALQTAFVTPLQPMAVARSKRQTHIAYTHPATADYLRQRVPATTQIRFCASKVEAYQRYCEDGEYVLTSAHLLTKADEQLATVRTKMVWSVYLIKEEPDEISDERS